MSFILSCCFGCSNTMGNCQTRLEQSPEAHHGPHLMRKILVSALKRSSKLLSRRGNIFVLHNLFFSLLKMGLFEKASPRKKLKFKKAVLWKSAVRKGMFALPNMHFEIFDFDQNVKIFKMDLSYSVFRVEKLIVVAYLCIRLNVNILLTWILWTYFVKKII